MVSFVKENALEILRILAVPVHVINKRMEIWRNRASKEAFPNYEGIYCYKVICNSKEICDDCAVIEVLDSGISQKKQRKFKKKVFDVEIIPFFEEGGNIKGVIETLTDVTAQIVRQQKLEESSVTDFLTKALNRRGIITALEEEIARANRFSEKFSVILFDLDSLKAVNDAKGHIAGDKLLRAITAFVKNKLRAVDKIGRYGGDEFLIVLPETSMKGAEDLARKLKKAISSHEFLIVLGKDTIELKASISTGVAEYHKNADIESMLQFADDRLYREKIK